MFIQIICFLLFIFSLYYLFNQKSKISEPQKPKENKKKQKSRNSPDNPKIETKKEEKKEVIKEPNKEDITKYLIKTVKEGNNISKIYFYKNGHIILFCDEKKISLCLIKNFDFKENPKTCSKTIEKDLIVDICLSPEKKAIFCANKNSKSILYYTLEKIESKLKIIKQEKTIQCERPYEIKSIVCDNAGTLICTIGTNDDTEIQIFEPTSAELKFKQSTSAIQNLQMRMSPNDSDLLISTFMNDISVLNFEKSDKFNPESKKYENVYKFKRNSSIPVKARPLFYTLSNNEKFFAVSCDDKSVKIFRIYGNISESKIYAQINLENNTNVCYLFVDDFQNGKLEGYLAIESGNDILIYDINGNIYKELNDAHDSDIVGLYLTKEDNKDNKDNTDKNKDLILISAGKEGRIKFWKI